MFEKAIDKDQHSVGSVDPTYYMALLAYVLVGSMPRPT